MHDHDAVREPRESVSPQAEIWVAARRSYVEDGCSSALVAERHGLRARTVRQRAADQGWREERATHRAAARRVESLGEPDDPVEALIAEQRAVRRLRLLVAPSAKAALGHAAIEISDAIARGAVLEVRQWQKILAELARNADAFDGALAGGADANARARIAYYRQLFLLEGETAPDG